ncbi:MAG: Calx-beta domain-containing protein [Gelidibacter sp.]
MKKIFKLLIIVSIVTFGFTSCDEDKVTYDALSFPEDQYIAFTATSVSANESTTSPIVITAQYVHADTSADANVGFTISSPTAVEGVDYIVMDGQSSFSFPAGVFTDTVTIMPIDNDVLEGDKVLTITLGETSVRTGAPGPDSLGKTINVTILEDDCARDEALRPFEGTYSGTDNCGAYASQMRLELPCGTGITVKGLGYPWLESPYWAETVVTEYDAFITIDEVAGTVDIPNQKYVATDYNGYVSDYFIVGSGTVTVSGSNVTMHIEYDITHPEYGSMSYDYANSTCPDLFQADVTLDQ